MLTEQIEAMWISRYDYKPGWYFNKHHHSYFQIIYIIAGSGSFYYQGLEKQLAKNKLFLMNGLQKELMLMQLLQVIWIQI